MRKNCCSHKFCCFCLSLKKLSRSIIFEFLLTSEVAKFCLKQKILSYCLSVVAKIFINFSIIQWYWRRVLCTTLSVLNLQAKRHLNRIWLNFLSSLQQNYALFTVVVFSHWLFPWIFHLIMLTRSYSSANVVI